MQKLKKIMSLIDLKNAFKHKKVVSSIYKKYILEAKIFIGTITCLFVY